MGERHVEGQHHWIGLGFFGSAPLLLLNHSFKYKSNAAKTCFVHGCGTSAHIYSNLRPAVISSLEFKVKEAGFKKNRLIFVLAYYLSLWLNFDAVKKEGESLTSRFHCAFFQANNIL